MLSRSAEDLYWMSRYVERAENAARTLDVSYRMSRLPSATGGEELHWRPAIEIGPDTTYFEKTYGEPSEANVIKYMALDLDNPSSILSCIKAARENARAERTAVTSEMWEALNATWLEIAGLNAAKLERWGYRSFFDWIKERSHLFRGVTFGTLPRGDAFHFLRLGTFLERADNTARILDVKYHVLLPEGEEVGGVVDYYQWGALLRSVSAFRAYRAAYRDAIRPWRVAELLILRPDMPRSLRNCFDEMIQTLEALAGAVPRDCHRLAVEIHASLRFAQIDRIVRAGLHEFLDDFVEKNNELGLQVQRDFMMAAPVEA
jgi:uncharacterized alpha-E superfamily protein